MKMTRIRLKPNSAEFADENEKIPVTRQCDMPGCACEGEHRAPKTRNNVGSGTDPSDYYWFCLPHVQEYNKAWDYFSGMSADEVETHIVRSMYWDRPTRRFDGMAMQEELRRKAWQTYHFTDKEPPKENTQYRRKIQIDSNTPEFQAMAIMGLEPPLSLITLKARYKELVKQHHPDVNGGAVESEELIKRINMAYTILKLAQEKFEKLPDFEG